MGSRFASARSLLTVLLLAVLATGCSRERSAAPATQERPAAIAEGAAVSAASSPSEPRLKGRAGAPLLAVTLRLSLHAPRVPEAVARLRALTAEAGGYVAEATVSGDSDRESATLVLRVPADRLAAFRRDVAGAGDVGAEDERVEDVTDQRADLAARLANARAEERRLLAILAERTGSLADVLAVEKELSRVREVVERLDGEGARLDGRIQLATVHVAIGPSPLLRSQGTWARIAASARDGVGHSRTVLLGITLGALEAGPTLLLLAALFAPFVLVARFFVRRALRSPRVA